MRAGIAIATIVVSAVHFSPVRGETAALYFNGRYTFLTLRELIILLQQV